MQSDPRQCASHKRDQPRCGRWALEGSRYCWVHGSRYCWVHGPQKIDSLSAAELREILHKCKSDDALDVAPGQLELF